MTVRTSHIPFKVHSDSIAIDGAGHVFVAFQCERGAQHTKYVRIVRLQPDGSIPKDGGQEVPEIYTEPKWVIHLDGSAIVEGMNRAMDTLARADVEGWVNRP